MEVLQWLSRYQHTAGGNVSVLPAVGMWEVQCSVESMEPSSLSTDSVREEVEELFNDC